MRSTVRSANVVFHLHDPFTAWQLWPSIHLQIFISFLTDGAKSQKCRILLRICCETLAWVQHQNEDRLNSQKLETCCHCVWPLHSREGGEKARMI
jgi:hypothetical protein